MDTTTAALILVAGAAVAVLVFLYLIDHQGRR
jgi:hypothetical protein